MGLEEIDVKSEHEVLGMDWDSEKDTFCFKLLNTAEFGQSLEPTKHNVLRLKAKMFDPTGLLSPIFVPLKVMFQQLCTMSVYDWDSPMIGEHLNTCYKWIHDLEKVQSISSPGYYFGDVELESLKCTLVGFGDASKDAYAAKVYLARQTKDGNETSLVASKTRVAPMKKITIPRLEPLVAVILYRLT